MTEQDEGLLLSKDQQKTWDDIVKSCKYEYEYVKSINVGSVIRRETIIKIDRIVRRFMKEMVWY